MPFSGGTKKSSMSLNFVRVVVREMMERCAGGSHAGGGGCTRKGGMEETASLKVPESHKEIG